MINKKIILTLAILMVGIFALNLATAADEVLTFKQYETIDLKLPCSYDGANCDVTAECNLSFIFPNGTFMVENQPMTNTGNGMPNYTLPTSSAIGEHNYKQNCIQNGLNGSDSGVVTITTTGKENNNTIPIFLLILAVILLVLGFTMENPIFGFFSGILFIFVGMFIMIYGFGDVADLYTRAFAVIMLALGMIISLMAGYSWLDDYD